MGEGSRSRGCARACAGALVLGVWTLVGLVGTARADIDPTGVWSLEFPPLEVPPTTLTATVHFVRTGTALVAYVQRVDVLPADQLSGTIDPVNGAFSVSGTQPNCIFGFPNGPVTGTLSGTFSAN